MKGIKKDKTLSKMAFCKAYRIGCQLLLDKVKEDDDRAFLEEQIKQLGGFIHNKQQNLVQTLFFDVNFQLKQKR